jgi:hypothetical protein
MGIYVSMHVFPLSTMCHVNDEGRKGHCNLEKGMSHDSYWSLALPSLRLNYPKQSSTFPVLSFPIRNAETRES